MFLAGSAPAEVVQPQVVAPPGTTVFQGARGKLADSCGLPTGNRHCMRARDLTDAEARQTRVPAFSKDDVSAQGYQESAAPPGVVCPQASQTNVWHVWRDTACEM